MEGRMENTLKIRNATQSLLENMPESCTGFYYSIKEMSPVTCYHYVTNLKRFFEYTNKDPLEIDEVDIGKYLDHIEFVKKMGKVVQTSAAKKRIAYAALNKYFTYLNKKGTIKSNPVALIERTKRKDNVKRTSLTMEEINAVLEAADSGKYNRDKILIRRDYLIIYLFVYTGMRESAMSQINISDIDFERKVLTVYEKRDKIFEYTLNKKLIQMIQAWLANRSALLRGLKKAEDSTPALFLNRNGNRLGQDGIYDLVKKYTEIATGKSLSPHKLRASFITLFYEASGHDIEAVREAVGHESIQTTSMYIAKNNNSRKAAARFMGKNLY